MTNDLTISMNPAQNIRLESIFADLPTPLDYFSGFSSFLPLLPHDVLAFQRSRIYLDNEYVAFHHRFVFIVAVQGRGSVILDGQMCMLSPGHGVLVSPYQSHYYAHLTGTRFRWLFLTFALDESAALLPLRNMRIKLSPTALTHLSTIMKLYKNALHGDDYSAGDIALHLALLLHDLLKPRMSCLQAIASTTECADERHSLAGRASQYVYQHIAHPLSPGDVACELDVSESHLRALFRQTVGVSLGKFIRQAKIFTACTLLRTSRLSVTAIAAECGYDSLYAFSRAFHNVMQTSPLQYRKRMADEATVNRS